MAKIFSIAAYDGKQILRYILTLKKNVQQHLIWTRTS